MAIRQNKQSGIYYIYFRGADGVQHTISTRSRNRADAERMDQANKAIIAGERKKQALAKLIRNASTSAEVAEPIKDTAPQHKRGSLALRDLFPVALTRNAELSALHRRTWELFCDRIPVKFCDQVTPAMALNYLDTFYGAKSAKTWNNVKGMLNRLFRLCLVQANIQASPFARITDRHVDRKKVKAKRNLTDEEIKILLNDPKTSIYLKTMMMISRWTGLRLKDCRMVTPEMFNMTDLAFIIDPAKNQRWSEWVCVPILPELNAHLEAIAHLIPDKNIPIAEQLGHVSDHALSKGFSDALIRLGIRKGKQDPVSFHSLRGSMITWMKENGIDADTRHQITGQDSDAIEGRYARAIKNISTLAKTYYSM